MLQKLPAAFFECRIGLKFDKHHLLFGALFWMVRRIPELYETFSYGSWGGHPVEITLF